MKIHKYILCIAADDGNCSLLSNAISKLDSSVQVKYEFGGLNGISSLVEAITNNNSLPNLIVVDLEMMTIDGKETFDTIREIPELKHIPILFLSKNQANWDITSLEQNGVTMFPKPSHTNDYDKIAETITYLIV